MLACMVASRGERMSVSLWKYDPDFCEQNIDCCGDCDSCHLDIESEEDDD